MRWSEGNVLPYVPSTEEADDADLEMDDEDDADALPKSVVDRPALRLAGRPAAQHAVPRDRDLRDARQGLHDAPPRRAGGPARHLRGPRLRRGDRLPQGPRRHRGRAAAGPPHRRRGVPRREGPDQLLGLLDDRLLRPPRALRGDRLARRRGARVQGHGQGAAPRGHRGDPRRRLQPHRRGQPPRADALLQGRRQQELLPARARGRAPLHGLHGYGQHAQRRAPERAAAASWTRCATG